MKKLLLIAIIVMCGCKKEAPLLSHDTPFFSSVNVNDSHESNSNVIEELNIGDDIKNHNTDVVITIDSCEYIVLNFRTTFQRVLHKSDCKFCTERRYKEIERIVQAIRKTELKR